jgi:hypothetical protein
LLKKTEGRKSRDTFPLILTERRYTRVAFAPCLAVVYPFLPIKVLSIVFRGVISFLTPLLDRKVHDALPLYCRREDLIADTATQVYLLSESKGQSHD